MADKIKICFFLGSLNIGGTEKNVVNILKNINRERFEPKLCCFFFSGPFEQEIKHLNIPILICNYRNLFDIRLYFRIIKFFRSSDILHCFGYPTIYSGVIFGRLAGVKKIIVAIQDRDVWKKWYHVFLDKLIRPFVDLYIADGKGTMDFAVSQQGIDSEKIITIYDGADIEALKPQRTKEEIRYEFGIPSEVPIVSVICRLDDKKKGVSFYLKSIPLILEKHADTRFLVVGDGEDRGTLEELAHKLRINDKVIFTGFRSDIPDILNATDIFLIPSLWESVPKILVDAMSMGKAIVATNVGDIPELLTNKKTGILINPAKEKDISDAVISLISNQAKVTEYGTEALKESKKRGLTLYRSVDVLQNKYTDVSGKRISFIKRTLKSIYFISFLPFVTIFFISAKFMLFTIRKIISKKVI